MSREDFNTWNKDFARWKTRIARWTREGFVPVPRNLAGLVQTAIRDLPLDTRIDNRSGESLWLRRETVALIVDTEPLWNREACGDAELSLKYTIETLLPDPTLRDAVLALVHMGYSDAAGALLHHRAVTEGVPYAVQVYAEAAAREGVR